MRLDVADGSATIEYDCGHGTIDVAPKLDKEGRFSLPGTFVREHGGPIRNNEKEDSHPASYTGRMEGTTMDMTLTLTDTKEKIGTFALTLGGQGRIWKCR
jgi:hypothetical protein